VLLRLSAIPALLALLVLTGCGTAADESAARSSATRFEAAITAKNGAAACHELSQAVSSSLESSEKKPCEQAILAAGLKPARTITGAGVWVTGAQVKLDGDTLFLDKVSTGWKVSAAGCKPMGPDEPYDCELEG
jgi:hypothetical protein